MKTGVGMQENTVATEAVAQHKSKIEKIAAEKGKGLGAFLSRLINQGGGSDEILGVAEALLDAGVTFTEDHREVLALPLGVATIEVATEYPEHRWARFAAIARFVDRIHGIKETTATLKEAA